MAKSLRILHFSDFHLNKEKIAEARYIVKYMQNCLKKICESKKIDLVLFSGDILDKGGASFGCVTNGLTSFVEEVIKPIMETIGLPMYCFIFAPGNHDIDRNADSPRMEKDLENGIETWEDVITNLSKANDLNDFTKRINEYKKFEKEHYSGFPEIEYVSYPLLSTFKLQKNGLTIGISSLNSVWRCGFNDKNKIVIGLNQITEHTDHLQGCDLKIALTHYPIDMLKDCEKDQATLLVAKEFDILCSGHAHSEFIKYEGIEEDASFLNVKSAGTLSDNIYEKNIRYKNAFQIIDFNVESGFCVSKYHQTNSQEFIQDNNFGCKKFGFPTLQERLELIKIRNEERIQQERINLKEKIYPFMPIDDYIKMSANLMSSEFITCPAIERIKSQLIDQSQKTLRLMALSGMGKTRIIAEAFRGKDNVFYSGVFDCLKAIPAFIELNQSTTLIVDDCDKDSAIQIQKLIDESGKEIRLITVYRVLTTEEKSISAPILELKYEDTKIVIDAMIKKEDSLKDRPEIIEAIKERSGGIPYMALLMIEAYKKNQNLKIEKIDDILSILMDGGKRIEMNTSKSMEALSLFEPLGYKKNYSDEYDWVCNTPLIHHLHLDKENAKNTIDDTIREFLSRQLIEEDGPCIRIRPRPLAEWLTEKWLEKNGEIMPDVFEALNSTEDRLKRRLTGAMSRRFQDMTDSMFARKLYAKLNDTERGSFHNERVAFTEVGSRLLLSMSVVNPQVVSTNIFSLLNRNTNEWIKENIKYETRRNLIYTLERTVSFSDAFKSSALALAKLANAENEDFGNNSTGIFNQLFHVFLSGTAANLEDRFSVILYLRENIKEYGDIVFSAINSALHSLGFSKICPSSQLPKDYEPSSDEVHVYWTRAIELLKDIVLENTAFLDKAAEIVSNHAFRLISYEPDLLFEIIDFISSRKDYDWPSMRESLSHIYYWENMTDENVKVTLKYWMDKLEPKSFFGKLKIHIQDIYNGRSGHKSFVEETENFIQKMKPFAQDFINNKIYETQEFIEACTDNSYEWFWLIRAINPILQKKEKAEQLIIGLSNAVQKLPTDTESRLILALLAQISDGASLILLRDKWYAEGRFKITASLSGIIENKYESQYYHIKQGYLNKAYDNYCLNNYLEYRMTQGSSNDIVDFAIQMLDDNIDKIEIVYPYLINRLKFHLKVIDENTIEKLENLLIKYEFSDSTIALNRDVADLIKDLLEQYYLPEFAVRVHKLIVQTTTKIFLINSPFDHIYFSLLPKYEDVLLPIILKDLAADDERVLFYHAIRMDLGSGFGGGAGPLFQCDINRIKDLCLSISASLPIKLANMCPVYNYSADGKVSGLSDFFLWLCDQFGDSKEMLDSFSSNMGTFSYCGNEISTLFSSRIPLFEPLLSHTKETVRVWAQQQIKSLKAQHDYEKENEDYRNAIYGRKR